MATSQCAAGKWNFCIEQGTTFNPPLRVKAGGVPVDITGWTFRMQIREVDQDGAVIVELTSGNGRFVIVDAVNGLFNPLLADTLTDTFTEAQFEDAVYDLEAIDSLGAVLRLLEGVVTLSLNITRS
jgi:hypothetical protein